MRAWLIEHRRLIALKVMVGAMLVVAHFWPQSVPALLVNLLWLFLF